MIGNNDLLWENDSFVIKTPNNPHIPYSEGLHIIVAPKKDIASAWQDAELTADAFKLAAKACAIMEKLEIAPWFNLQANGNWGLLPGGTTFFHIHVYGRNRDAASWGKPLVLPEAPGTYKNDPMPAQDKERLAEAFKALSE